MRQNSNPMRTAHVPLHSDTTHQPSPIITRPCSLVPTDAVSGVVCDASRPSATDLVNVVPADARRLGRELVLLLFLAEHRYSVFRRGHDTTLDVVPARPRRSSDRLFIVLALSGNAYGDPVLVDLGDSSVVQFCFLMKA